MNGRTGSSILRSIPRNRTSCGSSPQHTSSSSLFRLSPSTTTTITPSSNSQTILSRRALSSSLRQQTNASTLRAALTCEASTLRYALLLESEGEEALLRGWDAGVAVDDDDGTSAGIHLGLPTRSCFRWMAMFRAQHIMGAGL